MTRDQTDNLITMQDLQSKVHDLGIHWHYPSTNLDPSINQDPNPEPNPNPNPNPINNPITNNAKNLKLNLQYLLFNVFLYTKPKRADLGNVRIFNPSKTLKQEPNQGNYIIITDSDNDCELVLNEYKTSKVYGTLRETLDSKLVKVIKQSLALYQRDHLFVQTSGHNPSLKPLDKNNSYSQFVRRAFEQHFNKSMGVSLWRHVYIGENVDFNKTSMADLKRDARLSGHSVGMQLLVYRPVALDNQK